MRDAVELKGFAQWPTADEWYREVESSFAHGPSMHKSSVNNATDC